MRIKKRMRPPRISPAALFAIFVLAVGGAAARGAEAMAKIVVSPDGSHFVEAGSARKFIPWGFNYDRDYQHRLLEDYWEGEWEVVAEDFREMKALGANLVRIHLQFGTFMKSASQAEEAALARLKKLLELARETGLYLDLTGLGCYHKKDVPAWYDALEESARWEAQAVFWRAVAEAAKDRPEVFCYDLMNEPLAPGGDKKETEWLAGELAGKHYVQRITLDPAGREAKEVARQWIKRLTDAIREADSQTMVTVGVIPWAQFFPGAKPVFHSPEAGGPLDFVSVHFYPESGKIDEALKALAVYDVGKPLLIEEFFPMKCSPEELGQFIDRSAEVADGWVGFYWGQGPEDVPADTMAGAMMRGWLRFFQRRAAAMKKGEAAAE